MRGLPEILEHVDDIENYRDLDTCLLRGALDERELVLVAVDQHHPAPKPLRIATQAFGERL
jgi:hypothetical protein